MQCFPLKLQFSKPDEFSTLFFQEIWLTVKGDVMDIIEFILAFWTFEGLTMLM